jgi:hypothetical protein
VLLSFSTFLFCRLSILSVLFVWGVELEVVLKAEYDVGPLTLTLTQDLDFEFDCFGIWIREGADVHCFDRAQCSISYDSGHVSVYRY